MKTLFLITFLGSAAFAANQNTEAFADRIFDIAEPKMSVEKKTKKAIRPRDPSDPMIIEEKTFLDFFKKRCYILDTDTAGSC